TSCDETAAAVVRDGRDILSSVVASQIDIHRRYGGVVPELASRKHLEAIIPVVEEALDSAGLNSKDLDALAATRGPGLVGALLVGFSFAKGYAYTLGLPWCGVNHLEAHLNSVFLGSTPPAFPFAALLVSGGHTSIYFVKSHTEFEFMGGTRDDAAGEAFDKVSKMLGLGYPGGPVIGKLSESGDPARIRFPRPFLDKTEFDFSFSGIKTAVNRYIQTHASTYADEIPHIVAGFQEAVVDVLVFKLIRAAEYRGCGHIAVVGGVAANRRLRDRVIEEAGTKGLSVHIPPFDLCGDNAAMIAAAGYHSLKKGERSHLDSDVYSRHKRA
ncbi:MAG: tRNA (adenosine(37)-N6)-threonylcarbamoyltransferase complex transferase subunit TsaD, partial [Thermodesulfobacteriota bacterium]